MRRALCRPECTVSKPTHPVESTINAVLLFQVRSYDAVAGHSLHRNQSLFVPIRLVSCSGVRDVVLIFIQVVLLIVRFMHSSVTSQYFRGSNSVRKPLKYIALPPYHTPYEAVRRSSLYRLWRWLGCLTRF